MTTLPSTLPPEPPDCEVAFERMPWMINGSLAPAEAQELELHVAQCTRCQARLDAERDLFRAIRRPLDNVEHSPLAAWGRFEAALAGEAAQGRAAPQAANEARLLEVASPVAASIAGATSPRVAPQAAASRASTRGRLRFTLMLQAASIAALSVAVLWLLVTRGGEPTAGYRTVSVGDPALGSAGSGWRIAFDDAVTATSARELLARHGLRVVDGPNADNVYTVATQPVSPAGAQAEPAGARRDALAALRADPRVRLLEPLGTAGATR